jgi:hypothetical protein
MWHKDQFVPNFNNLHTFFKSYFYNQALLKVFYKKKDINYLDRFQQKSDTLFFKNRYFFF